MRKLILKMSISLDGFVGAASGKMNWHFRTRSDDSDAWTMAQIKRSGAHLMGHKTFNDMASFWPTSPGGFAAPMNEIPKVAFSRKGFSPPPRSSLPANGKSWADAQVVTGDLGEGIRKLKEQDGNELIAYGGAGFARELIQTGLIDEYWLLTHPVALGQGQSLFENLRQPLQLELIETQVFSAGAVGNVFRPA